MRSKCGKFEFDVPIDLTRGSSGGFETIVGLLRLAHGAMITNWPHRRAFGGGVAITAEQIGQIATAGLVRVV